MMFKTDYRDREALSGLSLAEKILIAKSREVSEEALSVLSNAEEDFIRRLVSLNPKTDTYTLRKLGVDTLGMVREGVAMNLNTAQTTLISLSYDRDPYVRGAVATNPNTPERTLKILSKDPDSIVLFKIAKSLTVSTSILFELAENGESVRDVVVKNPNYSLDKYIEEFAEVDE